MERRGSLLGSVVAGGLLLASPAFAQEKSVAVEILDILKANGQISDEQYRTLMKKAEAEGEKGEAAVAQSAAQKPDPKTMRVYWSSGLRMKSKDGNFSLKVGGRIMNDWAIYSTDSDTPDTFRKIGDGTEFRRARLYMEGEVYTNIKYKAQYDFGGQDADFKDVYIELKKIPTLGNLRIGHFKEPMSIEELTSSKYITFMERSLPNVFAQGRNTGFQIANSFADKRATAAVGVFRDVGDSGNGFSKSSDYNVTARITALPWYEDKGKRLLHVGFGYTHEFRHDEDSMIRFRARPEAHLGPRFVDTKAFKAKSVNYFNPEFAAVYGPFSLQGEYIFTEVNSKEYDDPSFDGSYIYGSVFLTPGDYRRYKTSSGAFDRVKPANDLSWSGGGIGAIEAAVRYSQLDLTDGMIRGGTLSNITAGLNWYLNPNVRFMLNYVYADQQHPYDFEADIIQMRAQIDF